MRHTVQHNSRYVYFCICHNSRYVTWLGSTSGLLYYQPHIFHFSSVFNTGWNNIDTRSIYALMTENIGKLCYILFEWIEGSCKQMSEIVRKHLAFRDSCILAKWFHFLPYIITGDGASAFCNEYRSAFYSYGSCIGEKLLLKLHSLDSHSRLQRIHLEHLHSSVFIAVNLNLVLMFITQAKIQEKELVV